MMSSPQDVITVKLKSASRARTPIQRSTSPTTALSPHRIPRVSRLMALAIHCDDLIRRSVVMNQSALAKLGGVTRARISQIMNLLNLAPEIQEQLLFLTIAKGRSPILLADLQPIAREYDWAKQWIMWCELNPGERRCC